MKRKLVIISCLVWLLLPAVSVAQTRKTVLLYPSVDQHGDSLTLSGLVSVPTSKPAKGIILVPHYTILANDETPSNKPTYEARFYQDEYVLLMPDYIGYGVTRDRVHPYLAGELTARNCVDMVLGAQPMLDSMQLGIPLDSIYIVGYSQGGFSALWTLRVIEESYADRIHVLGCFTGAGPYDVAVTYDESLARKKIKMPALVPLMIIGIDEAYDLHLDRSAIMTPAAEKIYREYIATKDYSVLQVYLKTGNHCLRRWLTAAGMDKSHPETQRLYEGLLRSSIVGENSCPPWTPKAPLYIFHSTNDDVVTVRCARHLQRCFADLPNVTFDIDKYGHHISASRVFNERVREMLIK